MKRKTAQEWGMYIVDELEGDTDQGIHMAMVQAYQEGFSEGVQCATKRLTEANIMIDKCNEEAARNRDGTQT